MAWRIMQGRGRFLASLAIEKKSKLLICFLEQYFTYWFEEENTSAKDFHSFSNYNPLNSDEPQIKDKGTAAGKRNFRQTVEQFIIQDENDVNYANKIPVPDEIVQYHEPLDENCSEKAQIYSANQTSKDIIESGNKSFSFFNSFII
jgi:hypothetical protein